MMNINIIAVGKLKEEYLRQACAEYGKRLGAYCKLKFTEFPESRLPQNPSEKEIKAALSAEGKEFAGLLRGKDSYNIALCIEGIPLSSAELSDTIAAAGVSGKSAVNIVIGSSFGIADEIKETADVKLSMSKMTFPHQLARVMILEQLYRAFMILNDGKYHK
jgi:23S rRNA (pseudouridine1915-N3)-methyltransferase